MPQFISDQAVRTGMAWMFIVVGVVALYWAWRGLRDGVVINPPDYPGDRESFDRQRETFLYWLNLLVFLAGGIAGMVLGTKGLGLW